MLFWKAKDGNYRMTPTKADQEQLAEFEKKNWRRLKYGIDELSNKGIDVAKFKIKTGNFKRPAKKKLVRKYIVDWIYFDYRMYTQEELECIENIILDRYHHHDHNFIWQGIEEEEQPRKFYGRLVYKFRKRLFIWYTENNTINELLKNKALDKYMTLMLWKPREELVKDLVSLKNILKKTTTIDKNFEWQLEEITKKA